MSFYFPTEFEEDYRRTNLALRYGALSTSFLGGLFLVLWHTHTVVYAILVLSEFLCMLLEFGTKTHSFIQFMLLLGWSTTATYMSFQRIIIQPIINAACDSISAAFLLWIMPIMVFTGVLYLSLPTFVMCFFLVVAMYDMILVFPQPVATYLIVLQICSWGIGPTRVRQISAVILYCK